MAKEYNTNTPQSIMLAGPEEQPASQPRMRQVPIRLHVPFRVDQIESVKIRGHLVAMGGTQVWTPKLRREQEPAAIARVQGSFRLPNWINPWR